MAKTLNFDAVIVETIDVTKHGKTYKLRDDIPMTTLVRTFELMELQQRLRGQKGLTGAVVSTWVQDLGDLALDICGEIFRHTLPEVTDEQIAATFSFEEQIQLVMLFFTNRSQQLQPPPSALIASSEATTLSAPSVTAKAGSVSATARRQQSRTQRGRGAGTSQPRP